MTWGRLEDIDYELLGYFLSCHLIVEHHLDQTLKTLYPELDWDLSKQTFAQKAALLSKLNFPEEHSALPAVKHLNSVRNKLSHRIDFKLQNADLLPLVHYLQKGRDSEHPLPTEPRGILAEFTFQVCAFFGGVVVGAAHHKGLTRDEV